MKQTLTSCDRTPSTAHFLREMGIAALLFVAAAAQGQCPMTCNELIQASLDENCEVTVTWDMLIEGNLTQNCIDQLQIDLFDNTGNPVPGSPVIAGSYVNQILTGKVTYTPTGSNCSTKILIEDKIAPQITCKDTLVSCFHGLHPDTTGFPLALDNCIEAPLLSFSDSRSHFNCTLSDTITIVNRYWTATDSSGNFSTCLQRIFVERPPLDDLEMPENLDGTSAPPLYCQAYDLHPANTGVPLYDSLLIDSTFGFYTEYQDVNAPICEGSFTVFRNWSIYDACRGETRPGEQIIHILDTLPPDLACPGDITVSVPANTCAANVSLPQPATYDSCSSSISVFLEGSFGIINGTQIPGLSRGIYPTTCHAEDDCGNIASCHFTITVKDNIPPVAVANSGQIVFLLPDEPTFLPATTFNAGSWDNCGTIQLTARRLDSPYCTLDDETPFDTLVPFFCCDAGQLVEIELKVTDLEGNSSIGSATIQVRDKLLPSLTCPDDLTIDCGDDFSNTSLTGEPEVTENCSGYDIDYQDQTDLGACGDGTVSREWTVTDIAGQSASCQQLITIDNLTPFYINSSDPSDPNDDVDWPLNYISTTCGTGLDPGNLPQASGFPQIFSDSSCQMIAVSHTDTWLSQPNNACIEILRSWVVIDWCQFNQATFQGYWQYGQIIRIQNSDPPVIDSPCDDLDFCSYDLDCSIGTAYLTISATDDCNDFDQLEFYFEIDHHDDGIVDLSGEGHENELPHPLGKHRIVWTVTDGCNNQSQCTRYFTIRDCKQPLPYCENKIVEITDDIDPMVTVNAEKFNAGSSDNCSPGSSLIFSFSQDTQDSLKTFDCSLLGLNFLDVWITDEEGNQDFCTVELLVQDNFNSCTTNASVSGIITLSSGDSVANVQVMINNQTLTDSVLTGPSGLFAFTNVPSGGDYTITPIKDTNPMNGVTTFDLLLISKHILAISPLDSPYRIIAADINRSGTITTADLVALRKMILFIDTSFPNNQSWRFIERNYQFQDPANPLSENFPEAASVNNLTQDQFANFIAIKIGDVNGSVNPQQ